MTSSDTAPILSVVVCTYNRARLMAQALRSLLDQSLSPHRFEILLVDNGSSDDTAAMGRRLATQHAHLRYAYEPAQGLSHARNHGWRLARGEYVGYLDDDAKAPGDWLEVALEIASEHAPAAFGGPYYPFYESAKPPWFRDAYESREPGDAAGPLAPDQDLNGGNMFVRRELLARLGGYDPRLGMTGDDLGYGEETQLQDEIRRADPEAVIYYDPRLHILHLARAEKLSLLWRARRNFTNGRTRARRAPPTPPSRPALLADLGLAAAKLAGRMSYRLLRRDRGRYPAWQSYAYEEGLDHFRHLGEAWERLTRRRQ